MGWMAVYMEGPYRPYGTIGTHGGGVAVYTVQGSPEQAGLPRLPSPRPSATREEPLLISPAKADTAMGSHSTLCLMALAR
jgi:hypothetical protein